MHLLGSLAQELGVVTFDRFMQEAQARRMPGAAWLKAKQAGLLNTFVDGDGVLHVAPPGQTPEQYRETYPERTQ